MPNAADRSHTPVTAHFEFEAFKPLPCGCVAAVHRTLDPGLSVVSLEAKGTYCGSDRTRDGARGGRAFIGRQRA